MEEKRGNKRYKTHAKVKIEGIGETDIQLNDISITGCRVLCPVCKEIELNKKYKMEIIPEAQAGTGRFELIAESRWIHTENLTSNIGFSIVESPKGKQFQHYVDYLSWR